MGALLIVPVANPELRENMEVVCLQSLPPVGSSPDTVRLVAGVVLSLKSRAAFQMENLALRHQRGVLTVPTIRFRILDEIRFPLKS